MKVVINKCYGGFGLSHEAMLKYFEYKCLSCYPEKDKYGFYIYWKVPESERKAILNDSEFKVATVTERQASNRLSSQLSVYYNDIPRDDPALVRVVEELGSKANDSCAELKIVEIPDGVDWEVAEYDGMEHIAQVHSTWG